MAIGGFEIRLKAAVDDVNNLSSAVEGALGTLALRYPAIALIGGAVAAGVAFRQALHGLVCGDGGIILASPWPIPLMLVPIRSSSNVKEDEMMWTVFSQGTWSAEKAFTASNFTKARPALAPFRGNLYLLHRGAGDDNIRCIQYDQDHGWGKSKMLKCKSQAHVASCEYKHMLRVVHRGPDGDRSLRLIRFDGDNWREDVQIAGTYTTSGPALAVFQYKSYWVVQGTTSELWYTSYKGFSWAEYKKLRGSGAYTSPGPALAVYKDTLLRCPRNQRLFVVDFFRW